MGVELFGEGMEAVVECGSEGKIPTLRHARGRLSRAKGARELGHPEREMEHLMREGAGRVKVHLTRKQRGEMAEAAFVAKASSLGLCLSKPWGESSRYDLIADNGKRLLRIQVKSAHRADECGGYTFHAYGNTTRAYGVDEIDVLVAYVVPENAWYVFPVEEFRKYKSMKLFPASRRRRSRFEKFREAWGVVVVEDY
jgi:PD-(D/E)XK nuclease superfamily protein